MATRPDKVSCLNVTYTASGTVTEGFGVKFGSNDHEVVDCGAGEKPIGVACHSATSGQRVTVAPMTAGGIVPVKVGTGGATRGAYAIMAADGWTDRALGGGTTARHIGGTFTQTGVAGDYVGMMIQGFTGVSS